MEPNLTEQASVVNLMMSSKSGAEWDTNCDKVKAANNNNYPPFWYNAIIASDIERITSAKWEGVLDDPLNYEVR